MTHAGPEDPLEAAPAETARASRFVAELGGA